MKSRLLPAAAAALAFAAHAQDAAVPPPPPDAVPPDIERQTELEPEVTIRQEGSDVIEEYRVGGQLYMVKITPAKGFPYYLIDSDGDGELESFRNDVDDPLVQQWMLFRW